jgi:hypothetical protein
MPIIKNEDSVVRISHAFDIRCKNCDNLMTFSEFYMDNAITSIGVEPCKHCSKEIEEAKNV